MWREKLGDHDRCVDSVEQRGNRIVVAVSWTDKQGERHRWAHVLKLSDGTIIDMQGLREPCPSSGRNATTRTHELKRITSTRDSSIYEDLRGYRDRAVSAMAAPSCARP